MYSSLQTLVSYLLPSPLYVLRYSSLLLCDISSLTSFVFGSGYPYWFVGFGIFLEFVDKVVKILLFLLPVLQRSLLEFWIVFLEQFFFGRRYPVDKGWATNAYDDTGGQHLEPKRRF